MANLFGLEKKLGDLNDEFRPNVKDIAKEDKVEEPKVEQPKPEPVERSVEETLSSEERNELDADERAAFNDKPQPEAAQMPSWEENGNTQRVPHIGINNRVPEIETDLGKIRTILQGAENNNVRYGGSIPWSLNLGKIETELDKKNVRLGNRVLLSGTVLYGKDSDLAAYLREKVNAQTNAMRSYQGFNAKNINATYTHAITDKNVRTSRTNFPKDGLSGLQPMGSAYG